MRKMYIIGIGAGNPEYVTVQAIKALNAVDVFFFMNKGEAKDDLVQLRREICDRYIEGHSYRIIEIEDPVRDATVENYTVRVEDWHEKRALLCEESMQRELAEDQCGAFLVWGDPSLYDSTLRIIDRLVVRGRIGFTYEVIPGITSVQALTACHRIPLNDIGESIFITTGRQLASDGALQHEKTVVMLDGRCSFNTLQDDDVQIFWGAYLGTDKELLVSGRLGDVAEHIEAVRDGARAQHGWIMDTYLLSKKKS